MAMLETVSHLLPMNVNENGCTYVGFVKILEHSYRMSMRVPYDSNLSESCLECEWRLESVLRTKTEIIQKALNESESLPVFFKKFIEIAESCLKVNDNQRKPWNDHTQNIIHQLQNIGWNKVVALAEDFSSVEFGCYDRGQRLHRLKVVFDKEDLQTRPICVTDLPHEFDFHWSSKAQLNDVLLQFEGSINNYQAFWDAVEEIDKNTWILEPDTPSYSCVYRRIALGQNLSLHVTINALQPSSLPGCRLLGTEAAAAPLREKLNVNLHNWDLDRSLLNNLQEVLELDFPTPSDTKKEEFSVECGICYSHQLGEEIPDIVCQHVRCSQAFHYACLYEWLRNSACQQSFNYIFGECPFCSKPLRVKIQMMKEIDCDCK